MTYKVLHLDSYQNVRGEWCIAGEQDMELSLELSSFASPAAVIGALVAFDALPGHMRTRVYSTEAGLTDFSITMRSTGEPLFALKWV